MDRKMIEQEYEVVDGRIRSSGKFENEPVYAPYFYEAMLEGGGDTYEEGYTRFLLDRLDVEEFPELAGYDYLDIREDDNGFVYITLYPL